MTVKTPKPTRRNPFAAGSTMAKQFDGMLKLYADGHRDVLRPGPTRGMGNSMAGAFWRGYDGQPPQTIPRNALSYACYRAGQAQRLIDNARGVFIPPKSNSIVKP